MIFIKNGCSYGVSTQDNACASNTSNSSHSEANAVAIYSQERHLCHILLIKMNISQHITIRILLVLHILLLYNYYYISQSNMSTKGVKKQWQTLVDRIPQPVGNDTKTSLLASYLQAIIRCPSVCPLSPNVHGSLHQLSRQTRYSVTPN